MTTGRKLATGGVIVVGVTGMMAYLGASASWQYYLSVDECVANARGLPGDRIRVRIRVNGKVARGSLSIAADRGQATFLLKGTNGSLKVICSGPLPDNLAEDVEVVVEGRLEDSALLRGDKVLTRCASKYKSKRSPASSESPAAPSEKTQRAGPGGG